MIIAKSDIKLIHFGVAELNYKCDFPSNAKPLSGELEVDLNYDIFKIDPNKNIFQLVLDLKLFPPDGFSGYSINLKLFGVFEIPLSEDKKQIDSALLHTCLPLILGYSRGFIAEITSHFPIGKYLLPSLSVGSILEANKNKSAPNKE